MATFNMQPKKNVMPTQSPEIRKTNFQEVAQGYDEKTAIEEAKRCLNCKNQPCVSGCPVNIAIPEFIACIKDGEFEKAYEIISRSSSLPAVCGRVCPQETQCEGQCTRGKKEGCEPVGIGYLERFVADYHNKNAAETNDNKDNKNDKNAATTSIGKVAIIGSGPAGLSCAGDLAKAGVNVTIFEALHVAGGVLQYGIPEFRLPKSIVNKEIENLKSLGVKIETNMVIGKTLSIEELKAEYGFDAVFIATGAGLPRFMNIEGESLKGVYSANEFLTRANLMKAIEPNAKTPIQRAKNVVVVGGGNVAMDAARTARRLGAEVKIVYRRSLNELPARKEEVLHAQEEGIIFETLTNPVRILPSETEDKKDKNYGCVRAIECVKMCLGEMDASGRRSPKVIENSEFLIECDCVIMALGTSPNPLIKQTTNGLETKSRGEIATDEKGQTSIQGVYAGGDAATGAATVIKAMGAGKVAAKSIIEQLQNSH